MSARPPLDRAMRLHLGEAVLKARAGGVAWKVLVRVYHRDRSQLWRYAQEFAKGQSVIVRPAAE
jgi:hypothetical protein